MNHIQIVALCGSLVFLALVLHTVRKGKLQEAYALVWIITAFLMLLLSVFERALNWLAGCMGIQTPAFALLLCLTVGMLLMIFQCTVIISRHQQKITILTEDVALLRAELDRMRKESSGAEDDK